MSYDGIGFVNNNPPAINAANLNKMDNQLIKSEKEEGHIRNDMNAIYDGQYSFQNGYIKTGVNVGAVCNYNNVTADNAWICTVVTGIKEGTTFHIQCDDANSARAYAWLDDDGKAVYVPTRYSVKLAPTQITCPSGASILAVNLRVASAHTFYRDFSIANLQTGLTGKVDKAGERQVTIDNLDFTVVVDSVNRCNPVDILWDKGIDASGNIVDSVGYILTGEIPVDKTYAYFGRNGVEVIANRLGLYKRDGTFERVSSVAGYDVSNCNYIRAYMKYDAVTDVFFVGFSNTQTAPTIDAYKHKVYIPETYLPDIENTNKFAGLQGVAFGTSLTARAFEDHKYEYSTYGYLTYLREYSGMTIDNQGIGGARILTDGSKSIYTAITEYAGYANKQICIIEGFVNDWDKNGANALGTYTDTTTNTVCGRLRNAINHILTQNANLTIFVILDHYGRDNGGEEFNSQKVKNGYTQYQYYDELKKVCESMGITVIPEYAVSEISELAPQYLADYIHCNDLGAQQSATAIWDKMKAYSPKMTV